MDDGIADEDFAHFLRLCELGEPEIDALRSEFPRWRRYARSQGFTRLAQSGYAVKEVRNWTFLTLLIQDTCRTREPAIEFGIPNLEAIARNMR